jgi:ADP-ribosylglycohydrolase
MSLEQIRGIVYGMAIGDALGAPLKAQSLAEIKARHGVQAIVEPGEIMLFDNVGDLDQNALLLVARHHEDLGTLHKVVENARLFADGEAGSRAARQAAAFMIALALNGAHDHEYARRVVEYTDGMSDTLDAAFYRVGHALAWGDEVGAMAHVYAGGDGESLVGLACYCLMRYPTDFSQAVRRAVYWDGDSQRLGYLVGALMGAKLGVQTIPVGWRELCDASPSVGRLMELLETERS